MPPCRSFPCGCPGGSVCARHDAARRDDIFQGRIDLDAAGLREPDVQHYPLGVPGAPVLEKTRLPPAIAHLSAGGEILQCDRGSPQRRDTAELPEVIRSTIAVSQRIPLMHAVRQVRALLRSHRHLPLSASRCQREAPCSATCSVPRPTPCSRTLSNERLTNIPARDRTPRAEARQGLDDWTTKGGNGAREPPRCRVI